MAQDEYYYQIELTNKKLIFYFLAGAFALVLSFLAGVMVGRGVDGRSADPSAERATAEDRIVLDATPAPSSAAPSPEDLTYAQRLESDRLDDTLERPAPSASMTPRPAAPPREERRMKPSPSPAAAQAAASVPPAADEPAPTPRKGAFSLQVGAFRDKATAGGVVSRLKRKGFPAFVAQGDRADGLFNVRVGSYADRAEAERVQKRLRDVERFQPFVVKN